LRHSSGDSMLLALEIVALVAIVVLVGALVPLLLQARRTAQALQHLAESAQADIRQVATDIHAVRERADAVADLAQRSLELPSALSQVAFGAVRALPSFFGRSSGGGWMEALMAGLNAALRLFERKGGA